MRSVMIAVLAWVAISCAPPSDIHQADRQDERHADAPEVSELLTDEPEDLLAETPTEGPSMPVPSETRECFKQDDCPEGLSCVAITMHELRCMAYEPAPPRAGPQGRPVPPVGLLDGSALRAQMRATP